MAYESPSVDSDRLPSLISMVIVNAGLMYNQLGVDSKLFPEDEDASDETWRLELQHADTVYTLVWYEYDYSGKVYVNHPINDQRADEDFAPVWELVNDADLITAVVAFLYDLREGKLNG